jgi:hypothetical protein
MVSRRPRKWSVDGPSSPSAPAVGKESDEEDLEASSDDLDRLLSLGVSEGSPFWLQQKVAGCLSALVSNRVVFYPFVVLVCLGVLFSDTLQFILFRSGQGQGSLGLLHVEVPPAPNKLVDYVRFMLLSVVLFATDALVQKNVSQYAVATEKLIYERRVQPGAPKEKNDQRFMLDMMLVKVLLVFFPFIGREKMSFRQAIRGVLQPQRMKRHQSQVVLDKSTRCLSSTSAWRRSPTWASPVGW